jgi:hypothetical protein
LVSYYIVVWLNLLYNREKITNVYDVEIYIENLWKILMNIYNDSSKEMRKFFQNEWENVMNVFLEKIENEYKIKKWKYFFPKNYDNYNFN